MKQKKRALAVLAVMVAGKIILHCSSPAERKHCLVSRIKDSIRATVRLV